MDSVLAIIVVDLVLLVIIVDSVLAIVVVDLAIVVDLELKVVISAAQRIPLTNNVNLTNRIVHLTLHHRTAPSLSEASTPQRVPNFHAAIIW